MSIRRFVPVVIISLLLLAAGAAEPYAAEAGLRAPLVEPKLTAAESSDLRRPGAPTESARPRFVRQTGKNCAFASAAMLIEKWTAGDTRVSQEKLRRASRVPGSEGVSLGELARGVRRATKLDLRYSPGGGDPLTWKQLLSRLARGGGAVLGGSYSKLPRHYQRHARGFAALGAKRSGHAVYIERYEATRGGGRVWMMDPLAKSPNYKGEWISAKALKRFAWINPKGLVSAAATPEPPPLAGYEFGAPRVDPWLPAGEEARLRLPVTVATGWQPPEGLALHVEWEVVVTEPISVQPTGELVMAFEEPDPLLGPRYAVGDAVQAPAAAEELEQASASLPGVPDAQLIRLDFRKGNLVGSFTAPADPGEYLLKLELRGRDGSLFKRPEAPGLEPASVRTHMSWPSLVESETRLELWSNLEPPAR